VKSLLLLVSTACLIACGNIPDVYVTNCANPDAGVCAPVDAGVVDAYSKTKQTKTTMGTIFATPGDKWLGGPAACTGQRIKHFHNGAAHRSLPCGTVIGVKLVRTGRTAFTVIIDRGPFWGRLAGQKRNYNAVKHWLRLGEGAVGKKLIMRGDLDITPYVAKKIGHTGLEKVEYWVVE